MTKDSSLPETRPATPTEEALILQMHASSLGQHAWGIYLRDPRKYAELCRAFGQFHETLDRVGRTVEVRACPAGSYPCGNGRCCIFTGGGLKEEKRAGRGGA